MNLSILSSSDPQKTTLENKIDNAIQFIFNKYDCQPAPQQPRPRYSTEKSYQHYATMFLAATELFHVCANHI